MTIEQLGNLAKNRYPDHPEYKGKSDREVGEILVVKHRAYRGRKKVDFTKKEKTPEPTKTKYPHMPKGYKPEGVVQYAKPIGPEPAPEPEETSTIKTPPVAMGFGITKGAASSILGLASLPHAAGLWLAEKITGKPAPEVFQKTIRQKVEEAGSLDAKGKWEKIGKGGEQLAEFFAPTPAGKSKGIAKGLEILNKIKKPASVTKLVSKVAPLTSRMVKEGARFGGVVAVQEGEIGKEAREAAMFGAAVPFVSAAVPFVSAGFSKTINKIGGAIKDKTQRMIWEGLLHRSSDEIIGNPIAIQTAKLGIVTTSRKAAKTNVEKKFVDLFNELKGLTADSKKKINVEELKTSIYVKLNEIEKARRGIKETDYMHELGKMLAKRKELDNIIKTTLPLGKKELTMKEAFQLQLEVFREIERNIDKTIPEITKLKVLLAKGLKNEINKLMPEIKTANDKVSVLAQVLPALEKAIVTEKAAFPVNQLDIITGLGGYAIGAGYLPVLAKKSIEQPIVQTVVSRILNVFNGLSSSEKGKFYLGVKGLLAGYVEEFIREK